MPEYYCSDSKEMLGHAVILRAESTDHHTPIPVSVYARTGSRTRLTIDWDHKSS